MTIAPTEPADVARRLANYSRNYSAGAFATPTKKDLEQHPEVIRMFSDGSVAIVRTLHSNSRRRDYTGAITPIPAGAVVVDHLLLGDGEPDLSFCDYINGYVEDRHLVAHIEGNGFRRLATRISAASEIIGLWWRGEERHPAPHDITTAAEVPSPFSTDDITTISRSMKDLGGWYDDFPYYSDGSWSALSLRGYREDDPRWGIKPAEMPKRWKEEHPEALSYTITWTTLVQAMPLIRERLEPMWPNLERVRLLRMSARAGGAHLSRHTDITDRNQGTRDGQVARFHIPLVTHPAATMTTWNLDGQPTKIHLKHGHCYYLDARKPHAVENASPIDRIHLVVDVLCDEQVRSVIGAAQEAV